MLQIRVPGLDVVTNIYIIVEWTWPVFESMLIVRKSRRG